MPIGYDNYRPNQNLLLDLQFRESTGTVTADWAKPYHAAATLTGVPTWQELGNDLTYLDFDPANPDSIIILAAASGDLDFTTEDFSGAMWIAPDAPGNRYLFYKAPAGAARGWGFYIHAVSPYLGFSTYQAGPTGQTTYGGTALDTGGGAWQFVGFSRDGAVGRIYLNGADVTTTPATHVDPASAAADDFIIGVTPGGAGPYDGDMWRPRIWNRVVTATEFAAIYAAERDYFGV
jgi:hypothetical protein